MERKTGVAYFKHAPPVLMHAPMQRKYAKYAITWRIGGATNRGKLPLLDWNIKPLKISRSRAKTDSPQKDADDAAKKQVGGVIHIKQLAHPFPRAFFAIIKPKQRNR